MSTLLYEDRYKTTKICIDQYKDKVPEGRIYQYHSEFEDGVCFHSTIDFLNHMERIMKAAHFPDYQECRTFQQHADEKIVKPSPEAKKTGHKATLVVKVLFHQHNSWQGTVLWCEKNKEVSFRSVLEFLRLIDSAVKE